MGRAGADVREAGDGRGLGRAGEVGELGHVHQVHGHWSRRSLTITPSSEVCITWVILVSDNLNSL